MRNTCSVGAKGRLAVAEGGHSISSRPHLSADGYHHHCPQTRPAMVIKSRVQARHFVGILALYCELVKHFDLCDIKGAVQTLAQFVGDAQTPARPSLPLYNAGSHA